MKYIVAFLLSLFLVVPSFAQHRLIQIDEMGTIENRSVPKEVTDKLGDDLAKLHSDLSKFLTPYKLIITEDHGGELGKFLYEYNLVRQLNGKVVIDGVCISGCALVLALVPRENICSTPFGKFGFHSASTVKPTPMGPNVNFSQTGTKYYFSLMPKDVIAKIHEIEPDWDIKGDKEHPEILFIDAQELVQKCPSFDK